jgi:PD-(D/E)XK nuclease superfamily
MVPNDPDRSAWDDARWRVRRDTEWRAGCRWLQAWWRTHHLGVEPGELVLGQDQPRVASMVPVGSDRSLNFLSADAQTAAERRLAEGDHSGIVDVDRLFRNLLSSQPLCFNVFGPFVDSPNQLVDWVETVDPDVETVERVGFEWAPDRSRHFGGGSAFDAVVTYRAAGGRRLIGIECKYAEDIHANPRSVRDVYKAFTAESGHWREGAARRLEQPGLWQFWLHTLLTQSITERDDVVDSATGVIMACAADQAAAKATEAVRRELVEPDRWLRWTPYEQFLASVDRAGGWAQRITERYLDFGPVEALLGPGDPRLAD